MILLITTLFILSLAVNVWLLVGLYRESIDDSEVEYEPDYMLAPIDYSVAERSLQLAYEFEAKLPDASGEAKRHQVYAQLIKEFRGANKKDLALAIELAVRRMHGAGKATVS